MEQTDHDHDTGAKAGGIDGAGDPQIHQDHKHIVEYDIQGIACHEGNRRQFRVIIAVDKVIKRPLAEHDGHQQQLGADQRLTVGPDLRARSSCTQEGKHLGQEQEAQNAQADIEKKIGSQDIGKNTVSFLRFPLAEGVGVVD